MKRYNPKEIEPKWQSVWRESGIYKTDMSRTNDKFYVIPMLPYPSGDLHIGHWYNFAPTDTVARFRRMLGQNVFTTVGFDAFGLPAENAAIKRGIQPAVWTYGNIATMTKQLEQIGASYDWGHSLATCKPDYYHWNQWLFLQLYERGLAYRAKRVVNWCPKDQTVLANEQVVGEENVCERCGTPVVQKELEQWFFKITNYADRLLDDLETVDWPAKVKTMQENWIGKSKGALIDFEVAKSDAHSSEKHKEEPKCGQSGTKAYRGESTGGSDAVIAESAGSVSGSAGKQDGTAMSVRVFTTRPDTIYGATYMVLAPEHPLVLKITSDECRERVENYIEETKRKTELERKEGEKHKTGSFTGAYAINPATKKKIPIWIADYVLASYGTGAIMAVPAHDERDWEFAKKFDLDIQPVVAPIVTDKDHPPRSDKENTQRNVAMCLVKHPKNDEIITLKWPKFGWRGLVTGGVEKGEDLIEAAEREITEETGYKNMKLVGRVPYPINSLFYAEHKDVNRDVFMNIMMFELTDLEQVATKKEAHEDFEAEWWPLNKISELWPVSELEYIIAWLKNGDQAYAGEGTMINSGKYDRMSSAEAREKIVADLEKEGIAKEQTNYKLRDWLISRQRYWGTPIPIIYCNDCGMQTVPEKDLPVILPEDVEFTPTGRNPLLDRPDFVGTTCPNCGKPAKRETDTMDTFVDSSWYFLRYLDNKNDKAAFDTELINKWMPMDHYIGGIEHAILHLLYARFVTKFLHDEHGLNFEEPFRKLTNQGLILGPDGQKMSKSKGNVINPDEQVTGYGADSLRLYLMFMGPYDQGGPYSLGGIAGTRRFLDRIWTLVGEFLEAPAEAKSNISETALMAATHRTIKKVTQDLEKLGFNTAIAAMMSLVNELYKQKAANGISQTPAWRQSLESLIQLLAPFAPHITEEMWLDMGHEESIHVSNWPLWDEKLAKEEMITLAVQINGKVRAQITVSADASEQEIVSEAREEAEEYLVGKEVKKIIYVPGRLVSLVV
ncbi:MAG TPA: class I tRNA ligase family protein [Candidatus Saccharimonadales bacterium]|nr:class I tRNA ligase family protein [Candidatus Saccharimonadales bacterium]